MVSPRCTTAVFPHGVITVHAPGPPPSIGSTKPFGVASTSAASLRTAGSGTSVVDVVVVATVVVVVLVVDDEVVDVTACFGAPLLLHAARRTTIAAAAARRIRVP